jgi:hypothetical protein
MRQSLIDLINKTIIFQYSLDEPIKKIDKQATTNKDDCYLSTNDNDLVK